MHAPLQPANAQPGIGSASSRTELWVGNGAEQDLPQSIPAGALRTRPFPLVETASWKSEGRAASNLAVTSYVTSSLNGSIVHEPEPEQAPLQPANSEPGSALAVSVGAW